MQRVEALLFKFPNPAFVNLVDWNRVEVVQLFPSLPLDRNQIGVFQQAKVLRDRLPRHAQSLAQLTQRLSVLGVQAVEQFSAAGVGQGLEHGVYFFHGHVLAA